MEVEIRAVGGVGNCYASLPLSLIHSLQSTHPGGGGGGGGPLPPLLPLQLRLLSSSSSPHRLFHLAWSGSASSSSAIEIAQEFAECIGLPDHAIVQVRALPNVPKASFITIEPLTEDDWEVLELNSEAAEAAILSQVRVVHEKMKFPLWLHGHKIVTFTVVSMVPNKAVVQLVPGSEVAVAPKRRKKSTTQSQGGSHSVQKALLRVQDPKRRLIQQSHLGGGDVGIELTSVALIHPETAKRFLFDLLEAVVILPRLPSKLKVEKSGNNMPRKDFSSTKEQKGRSFTNEEDSCYAVVHLLFSESVGKGHLMLCQSLRSYLRVSIHSWVYVQRYVNDLKKDVPLLSLSPCQFVKLQVRKNHQYRSEVLEESSNPEGVHSLPQMAHDIGASDGSLQEELVSALTDDFADTVAKEVGIPLSTKDKLKGLVYAWLIGQLHGISSISGGKATSLVLGPTTFLCFKLLVSNSGSDRRYTTSTADFSQNDEVVVRSLNDLLYVLNASAESLLGNNKYSAFEISVEGIETDKKMHGDLKLLYDKISLGSVLSYKTCKEHVVNQLFTSAAISSLSWMGTAVSDVVNRLMMLLSPAREAWFSNLNLPFPGHILIYGPPGSGKTLVASTAAKSLESNRDILVHTVFVPCSTLAVEKVTSVRQMLCEYVSEALEYAPSVIIFDDLDSLITSSSDFQGSQLSASVVALSQFITGIMDEYEEKRKNSCGLGPIAFVACVRALDSIPQSLRASGRFDFHIQLPAPSTTERLAILRHEIQKRSLQCSDDILLDVASKSDGYDAYDLGILVDRSVHAAISRFLPSHENVEGENPSLTSEDFSQARNDFLPVSMRDITKSASDGGRAGWEDVGGLIDVRNSIKEMIELPSKFPHIFGRCPLRLRSNVLLYGPPGCGKTHIVGAAAAASSLRFISIKGPELLNKYIGASEQAVRDVFAKAAAAAPCLLFFDEFDSIAPKRGHDNTGVTDRVVNQFLTELDGVEVLTGVFVFAATSRPDLLDAALLRPGRLDRLLFCDFPGVQDRLDILRVLSSKLRLADDVDLETVAHMTDGFSGADLQALLSDAQLAAVQELLDGGYEGGHSSGKSPVISDDLLKIVASKAKPSVSESEKKKLYGVYYQFVDSKRSVAAQSRDVKGKRATLA